MAKKYVIVLGYCLISLNYVSGLFDLAAASSHNISKDLSEEENTKTYAKKGLLTTTEKQKASKENRNYSQENLIPTPRISKKLNAFQYLLDGVNLGHNDILKQESILETKVDTLTQMFSNFISNEAYDVDTKQSSHLEQEDANNLSALEKIIPARGLQQKLNHTLEKIVFKMTELTENFNARLMALQNLLPNENSLNQSMEALSLKITYESDKIEKKIDLLEKKLLEVEHKLNQVLYSEKKPGTIQINCKELLAREYKYDKLIPLNEVLFDNTKLNRRGDELVYLEMDVAVKGARDGIIMLSPVESPGYDDFVFEIGVGLGENKKTELRLRMANDEAVKLSTKDILSASHFVVFKIKISEDLLEFTKKGDSKPLISFHHSRIRTIKYFGFASWDNNDAKLLYDCPLAT